MCANLTSDGMFLPLFFNGKGVEYLICENNRKSIKNMHCFDFFFIGSFEDMDFFTYFNLVFNLLDRFIRK